MKIRVLILLVISLTVSVVLAADQSAWIHEGFGKGEDYIKMTEFQRRAYAIGAINGMLLAPLFGAPKDGMEWFESYVENMTDKQVTAILAKYLEDNPGRWHDGLHVLMYSAIKDAYDKSRSGRTR